MTHARDYFPWTEEHVRTLRRMCAEGCTARVIAAELGTTRNSVIAKVHRQHLRFQRKAGQPRKAQRTRPRRAKPRPAPRPASPAAAPLPLPLPAPMPAKRLRSTSTPCTIIELTGDTCRWPLWADDGSGERLYCGGLALQESPYCAHHAGKAYGRNKPAAEEKLAC